MISNKISNLLKLFHFNLNYNTRIINKLQKTVVEPVHSLRTSEIKQLSNELLKDRALALRNNFASYNEQRLTIEALALVSEASYRTLGLDPFDVQLIGAIMLYKGKLIEMQTGEGKTLVAALAAFLLSLQGKGVHIATVNEYLVVRDYEQMQPMFDLLGTSCQYVIGISTKEQRQAAYKAHVTYSTSTEFGFDYLRDNLCLTLQDQVHNGLYNIIIDEADSNMLDEALTPLIISDPSTEYNDYLKIVDDAIRTLDTGDINVNIQESTAFLTDVGYRKIEDVLIKQGIIKNREDLYTTSSSILYYLHAAVKAHTLYQEGREYIVKDKQIQIISDKTGRTMQGRRWSDGLHQAIEMKERVRLQPDSFTSATITLQNFYKIYQKFSGMTGTAATDAVELKAIYNIDIVVIPTNKPCIRFNHPDVLFAGKQAKYQAVVEKVIQLRNKQQPILIGTTSIQDSEILSKLFQEHQINHQVLNAKFLREEANIIAQAGRLGTITIATNMAGRGTDIILGGNINNELAKTDNWLVKQQLISKHKQHAEQVVQAGGLMVIGTERNKVRRIDNQLIGRCGRQGDPGESQFFVSLEDNLIKHFTEQVNLDDSIKNSMEPIAMPWLSTMMLKAQNRVMRNNFNSRKALAKDGNLIESKRKIFIQYRQSILQQQHDIDSIIDELVSLTNKKDFQKPSTMFRDHKLERRTIVFTLTNGWKNLINNITAEKKALSLRSQCEQRDHYALLEKQINSLFNQFIQEYRSNTLEALTQLWTLSEQYHEVAESNNHNTHANNTQ